jgi:EAL domain-containing protein (putative c-di-GMP-specific phosphodiesterase class I)
MVEDTLRENDIDPQRLEIELTESLLMEDTEANRAMLEGLSKMGVRLAIDDFGTGHSSLSYLKRFKIDTLKIDRSFVSSLPGSSDDKAIATAVIALARGLDMSVVAEGVETVAQADLLRELGCDDMQGYLLSRPLPAAELVDWLNKRNREEARRKLALGGPLGNLQRMSIEIAAG